MRAEAGIGMVQRQARLPVPSRPHQRRPPGPGRPKNTYVREDQILPHLAAIGILLAGPARTLARGSRGVAQVTGAADAGALIDQLRAGSVALIYHPDDRTLYVSGPDTPSVTIGKNR
jgi:site-specific DNA recombinase